MKTLLALLLLAGPVRAAGFDYTEQDSEARQIQVKSTALGGILEPVVERLRTEACESNFTQVEITASGNVFCQAEVMVWEPRAHSEMQREFLINGLRDLNDAAGGPVRVFRDQDGKGYLVHQGYAKEAKTLEELRRNNAVYDGFDIFLAVNSAKGSIWLRSAGAQVERFGESVTTVGFDGPSTH